MRTPHNIGSLVRAMEGECALLEQFRELEVQLKGCIHAKDWSGLESVIGRLNSLAINMADIEAERHAKVLELRLQVGESEEATFYQLIVHLPPADRERLAELYRRMKLTVVGIQSVTWCISEHVHEINDTLQQVLGELFPHRKGSLYSQEGTKTDSGESPMLVNHSL